MKITHYYLSTLLCLLFIHQLGAQNIDWFALNDCGHLINARGADSDRKGNFYVTGDYKGEVLFKSVIDSGATHHTYVSENLQNPFLAKYDSNGVLKYVKSLERGYNTAYAVAVKTLTSGEVAWIVRADGEYPLIDSQNEQHTIRGREQSVLILFSNNGEYVSHTPLALDYCREIFELPDGKLLLFGRTKSRKNELHSLDLTTNKETQLFPGIEDLQSISLNESNVYLLSITTIREQYKPNEYDIRLYSGQINDLESQPEVLFKKYIGKNGLNQAFLFSKGEEVELILALRLRKGTSLSIDGQEISAEEEEFRLLKYNQEGVVTAEYSMNSLINGLYNTSLKKAMDGAYYLLTPAMDEIIINQDSHTIPIPEHGDFINELALIKLDSDFNFRWKYLLGGTASNYHQSFIVPHGQGIYFTTDLLDFVTIDTTYHELNWRAGLLLGYIQDKK